LGAEWNYGAILHVLDWVILKEIRTTGEDKPTMALTTAMMGIIDATKRNFPPMNGL